MNKMDDKLKTTINKIVQLSKQNPEFDTEVRKALGLMSSTKTVFMEEERIGQIYEYCIETIIRKQAEEFYKDFPVKSIVPELIEDFARMESFRRRNQFGDFCLALYQQIEGMTNKLCEMRVLSDIVEKMWSSPAYVKSTNGKESKIDDRTDSSYSIAMLLFPGQNKKTGQLYSIEKSRTTLQSQYANDKIRIVVYFLGYKAMMKASDYDSFVELTGLLSDIYVCRNMNHRGNTLTPWEEENLNRIIPLQSFYYFKFMGVLAQYVEFVKQGFPVLSNIESYANSLKSKKVELPELKVLGKIELKDDGKKRFK